MRGCLRDQMLVEIGGFGLNASAYAHAPQHGLSPLSKGNFMKRITKLSLCLAVALSHSTFQVPAFAATATTNFPVTATVIDSCTVSASPFAFGNYDGLSMSNLDASGAIAATCTFGTPYSVALDAGLGTAATMSIRKLKIGRAHV